MTTAEIDLRTSPEDKQLVVKVLQDARKLIDTPEQWTQGTFATSAAGDTVGLAEERAACFCIVGAVHRVSLELDPFKPGRVPITASVRQALEATIDDGASFGSTVSAPKIVRWNDSPEREHSEVLALIDATIKRLTGQ